MYFDIMNDILVYESCTSESCCFRMYNLITISMSLALDLRSDIEMVSDPIRIHNPVKNYIE